MDAANFLARVLTNDEAEFIEDVEDFGFDPEAVENLAQDSGIIVAMNHNSWFDPFVVAQFMWDNNRPPKFLAKSGIFKSFNSYEYHKPFLHIPS